MPLTRSENMSRIRSRNTLPERTLAEALKASGIAFDEQAATPVGRPDITITDRQVAIFIDGCFWHGCPEHYVRPRSRAEFWSAKLRENVERDRRQTLELERLGWCVVRVWEHEVFERIGEVLDKIENAMLGEPEVEREWRVVEVVPLTEDGNQERRIHELLRNAESVRELEQARHTRKWRRPKGEG